MSNSPGRREVAHRVFAAEYDAADYEYSESDEERAPNYVVTPTGARVNRLFAVGVLTEVEQVGEEVLRARVVDPTGAFVVYAGQYQPEAMAFLEGADPPAFVAVTGKARTFSPDDSDVIYTSIRPESVNEVDADTRDRWTVRTAEHTLSRVATFDAALDSGLVGDQLRTALEAAGVPDSLAAGIPVALDRYGTTAHYLASVADLAVEALRVVAGEVDEVEVPAVEPDTPGSGAVDREQLAAATDLVGDLGTVDLERPDDEVVDSGEGVDSPMTDEGERPADTTTGSGTTGEDHGTAGEVATASTTGGTDPEDIGDFEAGGTEEPDHHDGGGADVPEGLDSEPGSGEETTEPTETAAQAAGSDDEPATSGGEGTEDVDPDTVAEGETAATDAGAADGDPESGGASDAGIAPAESDATSGEDAAADVDVDEPPEEVLDEEERKRIESEYGTDFQTGTEVEDPGEAGIEPEAGPIGSEETSEGPARQAAADADATPTEGVGTTNADSGELGDFDAGGEDGTPDATSDVGEGESERDVSEAPESTTDEETGTQLEGSEGESVDRSGADAGAEVSGPPEDFNLTAAVLETMEQLDDGTGADRDELITTVVDAHGVSRDDVEDAIEDALMGGQCYEPDDGKLSAI